MKKETDITPESMDAAKARAMIQAENQHRADACMADIQATLARHKCTLQFIEVRVNGQPVQTLLQAVPQAEQ